MITCRGLAATTHRRHSRYLFEAIVKADERDDGLIVKAGERDDGLSGSCSSSSTVLVGAVVRGLAEAASLSQLKPTLCLKNQSGEFKRVSTTVRDKMWWAQCVCWVTWVSLMTRWSEGAWSR